MEIGTRAEAIAAGEKHYYTGELCKNGHKAKRYVQSGTCSECIRISSAKAVAPLSDTRQQRHEELQAHADEYRTSREALVMVRLRIAMDDVPFFKRMATDLTVLRHPRLKEADVCRKPAGNPLGGAYELQVWVDPQDRDITLESSRAKFSARGVPQIEAERKRREQMAIDLGTQAAPEFIIGKG